MRARAFKGIALLCLVVALDLGIVVPIAFATALFA